MMRLKPRANTAIRKLEAECDCLWQQVIVAMFGGYCALQIARHGTCMVLPVSGHHIIGRRCRRTRHSILCGVALCVPCHRWAEEHPKQFKAWLHSHLPCHSRWLRLARLASPIMPIFYKSHLEKCRAKLTDALGRIEA